VTTERQKEGIPDDEAQNNAIYAVGNKTFNNE
jgi:hypothetical protein